MMIIMIIVLLVNLMMIIVLLVYVMMIIALQGDYDHNDLFVTSLCYNDHDYLKSGL